MTDFTRKLQHFVENQFPDHIRADHPVLVEFLEAYYKFLDQSGSPANLLLNSASWSDIDTTLDLFVPIFRKQYAVDIPNTALLQSRRIVKHINEYYEAKGSENATKMFFRFMYNEDVSVEYPGDYVLRASDGKWSKKKIIKVDTSAFESLDIFELKNKTISLNYVEFIPNQGKIVRSVNTSCLNVTKQIEPNIYQLEVTLSVGYQFPDIISQVTNTDINRDGIPETIGTLGDYDTHVYVIYDGEIYGSVSKQIVEVLSVVNAGENFRVDDAYVIGQTGIEGRYFVLSGLSGYTDDPEGPYVFEEFDNNAIIRVSRITGSPDSGVEQIQLVNTGQKFVAREINTLADVSYFETPDNPIESYVFNVLNPGAGPNDYATDTQELVPVNTFTVELNPRTPRNLTGEPAEIIFRTGLVYEQPGTFKDSSGFLSDINHLQDSNYYQPYSYVVQSTQPKSIWEDAFTKSNHPAGFKLFSVLRFSDAITTNVSVDDTFNVVASPLALDLLQGDVVILTRTLSPSETWSEYVFDLTTEEIALIVDPDDLQLRLRMVNADSPILVADISLTLSGTT